MLIALPALAGAARAAEDAAPLPWRVGGRVAFTVDAAAFPDTSGLTLDVYVRIPNASLAGLDRDSLGVGRVRVVARLRGAYGGGRTEEQAQEFAIEPADSSSHLGKVVGLRFAVRPGRVRLAVRLEDVLSRRQGLIYAARSMPESGRIEGEIVIPGPESGREMSNLEFVWTESAGGRPTSFARAGRTLLPNPERLYGLLASEMRATFAARAPQERPWHWTARVADAQGRVVAERESTAAPARECRADVTVDVSTEPAGGYDLELRAWQDGDEKPLRRVARFSVAWQRESWLRTPRDVQDDIHFLFGPDEEDAFALLSPGEQERALEDFWKARDPSPATGENEARMTFLRRVEIANRLYGRPGLGKGMFSDMGRVFIRYGQPSEIVNQVVPSLDQGLEQMIDELTSTEDRAVGDVRMKGPGGDPRPFELWIYEGPIDLPPDADPNVTERRRIKRLVFLFVDERGTGDFRLRYSTE